MTILRLKTLLALVLACMGFSVPGMAQESAPVSLERVALTEAPKDDLDFELLGEFVGLVTLADDKYEPLGLQIRPLGRNNFEALQFIGGLPGQEGFTSKAIQLIGRRHEQHMILSGGPWAIIVHKNNCLIIDESGKSLGKLERIKRGSPTMDARPPQGALVLFDGKNTNQFVNAKTTEDGLLMAGADIRPMFQDFNMHLEFRLPYMPHSDDQARGNSGCYLQSRYEVQILDSFAQLPKFNGASSLYRTKSPDVNMSYPPLVWQTYDIMFTAPRWSSDGSKIRNATITVWHNGVKTQDNYEVPNKTGAGKPEEPNLLPIKLQDHRDPVVFRNIWIVDRGLVDSVAFPVLSPTAEELAAEAEAAKEAAAQAKAAAEEAAAATAKQDSESNKVSDKPAENSEAAKPETTAASPAAADAPKVIKE